MSAVEVVIRTFASMIENAADLLSSVGVLDYVHSYEVRSSTASDTFMPQ